MVGVRPVNYYSLVLLKLMIILWRTARDLILSKFLQKRNISIFSSIFRKKEVVYKKNINSEMRMRSLLVPLTVKCRSDMASLVTDKADAYAELETQFELKKNTCDDATTVCSAGLLEAPADP